MGNQTRWGILGTGAIAKHFATGLSILPNAELVAVGSRSSTSAAQFAELFDVPHRHSSYRDLANDPDVDVVYIAVPHTLHKASSLLCLQAGKPVLCEKPFTVNAREAEELITFARQQKLFLMEAMWTRFLPSIMKLQEVLSSRVIGDVRMLTADFGFRTNFNPQSRLFDPALGGGALLDVGVYPVSLASMLFGAPEVVSGLAHLGETGVDEQSAMIFGYREGQLAILSAAIRTTTLQEAAILGTQGSIKIHAPWWRSTKLSLSISGQQEEVIEAPFDGNGYNYEAAEVMRCLEAGQLESDRMPLDETLSIMKAMDQVRAQWGLKYPME